MALVRALRTPASPSLWLSGPRLTPLRTVFRRPSFFPLAMATVDSSPLSNGSDSDVGFTRKEMYASKLVGTVKEYDTHLFFCVDLKAETWPKGKVEDISERLSEELKSRKKEIPRNIKLTLAEACGENEAKHGDVLVFPDMKRYSGITEDSVPKFVDEVLIGTSNSSFSEHSLSGIHFFVCCHSQWDSRCGACGPPLVDEFRALAKQRGLESLVTAWPCSHIGGHKYAGNVILYNPRQDGTVAGDWYGYVTPKDVPTLLDAALNSKIVDPLWRGGLGLSKEAQELEQSQRLAQNPGDGGCGANCACIGSDATATKSTREAPTQGPAAIPRESKLESNVKPSKAQRQTSFVLSNQTATVLALTVAIGAAAAFWYFRTHKSVA